MNDAERYKELGERADALGFDLIVALVPKGVQKGDWLRVKSGLVDTGNDLAATLTVIEGQIAVAEIATR